MEKCNACPRRCGAVRKSGVGACGVGEKFLIARVGLHQWEEPCISYKNGSGTIFFGGCPLHCVFCQNHEISSGKKGVYIEDSRLEELIFELCEMGASNINLVSPTQYALRLASLLSRIKDRIKIPIVYNTGGYESVETIKALDGLVDVYLPDVKFYSPEISKRYTGASDYFERCICAVTEMLGQTGYGSLEADGSMLCGTVVRHLVLPSHKSDSMRILDELAKRFEPSRLFISIMRQYFPTGRANQFPEINRKLTTLEYQSVVDYASSLGFVNGYTQERSSATGDFVPDFDFEG